MRKQKYLDQLNERLRSFYKTVKLGQKVPMQEKCQLEGFMQAGVVIHAITKEEVIALKERIHLDVFGVTIAEKKRATAHVWKEDEVDYTQYDVPPRMR